MSSAAPADPMLADLERAAFFFDERHRAQGAGGWAPSVIMIARYCNLMTRGVAGRVEAQQLAGEWLDEGRRRWKAGFYADPRGERVRRPDA